MNNLDVWVGRKNRDKTSLEMFPTPPWATRAFFKYVNYCVIEGKKVLEPACGMGHMSNVLKEYFSDQNVISSDIHDYGYGDVKNFFDYNEEFDWIITNPPFIIGNEFVLKALELASNVAIFQRLTFLESIKRYELIYEKQPPYIVGVFTERVQFNANTVKEKGMSAVPYAWYLWTRRSLLVPHETKLIWIPPCKKQLERPEDYEVSCN